MLDPIVAIRYRITLDAGADGRPSTWSPASATTREAALRAGREVPATGAWPTACSSWRGRTARSCCASSTPPRPTRSSTGGSPARCSTRNPSLRADARVLLQQPARPVRPVGLRHLRRPADRAAADRRCRQHRAGAPARAGARVLAPEGPRRRPGDLERGPAGYRQLLQDQIMGLIAAGVEAQRDRPARRHLRAPRRADRRRGPRPAAVGRARRSSATAAARWPSRSSAAPRVRAAIAASSRRRAPRRAAGRDAAPMPRRDLLVVNGLGGFTADGREYVITTDARAAHAGAVGRTCSPTRSSARVVSESGRGLHLVRERARVPPDAVAQRSGQRPERRGVLPARRGDRPLLVADAAAVPRRAARTSPATASATACSSTPRTASHAS